MVKQLGGPTRFMTVLSADLKWNELVSTINKLHKVNISEKDTKNLTYHDRCGLLNSNQALCYSCRTSSSPHMRCFM